MKIVAAVTSRAGVTRILGHLGFTSEVAVRPHPACEADPPTPEDWSS
jgi:hypothetical protein